MRRRDFCKLIFVNGVGLVVLSRCKSPVEPEEPDVLQYIERVKVTYDRNPANITRPEQSDRLVSIQYELFDPDLAATEKLFPDDGYYDNLRHGSARVEKIAENRFVGYIEHVFIQTSSYHPKHIVYMADLKLGVGADKYTSEGVTIEGAYDIEIKHNKIYFKIK